ncbi:dimethylsulfonioproprionate lyase family protein [Ruegeria hyattellae]|uniref:dimethylsulfonioproprionate lyase family protein n=1 Tax=Ruegeria hyattellae TaxID=3233337 RepID=UPI00355B6C67
MTTLDDVLAAARALHRTNPDLSAYAPWPDDLVPTGLQPCPIPATDLIADFDQPGTAETRALVSAVRATVHLASWQLAYTEEEVGADFLNRYGYYELFGPSGHFHSAQLRGYIAYWGAGLNYGWHSHEAEELYLTLAGSALFKVEGCTADIGSGQTRFHGSWQSHAMDTTDQPILTLILWRGEGMAGLPHMDAA